jgi:hypothetical protein
VTADIIDFKREAEEFAEWAMPPLPPAPDKPALTLMRADQVLGYVVLESWIEDRGGLLVGMGKRSEYSRDGTLLHDGPAAPTGVIGRME